MFKQPLHRFFNALTFYTRIPGPNWVDYSAENLNRASAFFPLMGYIVAIFCYAVFWLCQQIWPSEISILISMVLGILLTGAFHEDGFADLCDGFGGGYTQTDILRIMKDSRLGTYGVCGLVLILAIKFNALNALGSSYLLIGLLTAHALSRAWTISLIMALPYVQQDAQSKAKPIAKQWFAQDMILAWCFALAPLLLLPPMVALALVMIGLLVFALTQLWFKRKLQGYTGDALGASQQIHEILIYLVLSALLV